MKYQLTQTNIFIKWLFILQVYSVDTAVSLAMTSFFQNIFGVLEYFFLFLCRPSEASPFAVGWGGARFEPRTTAL
jgi:hypothetical protein